ncbi:cyclic pyranopterin monophosphate synthase MoaC [Asticcacaulis sp. 201]|uniref:cyclic pyranopterin monophosphate synthase MoaC n=1 Tax=Asticcacaulis sp. 201 TaxID=3028787 RepID=UPI002916A667|nr:cyclic pyranopterin monophosphate synthase MoaC [Asticcacaulis sp. 201]MDV6330430.1 cyclic pyranopterin monophosphate synthase MoaC [Asticcacaulis sp. 201]
MSELSHLDDAGRARMVDVSDKAVTARLARAEGCLICAAATVDRVVAGTMPKGAVISTAELAGIMAAKQTANLIPLCHPLALSQVAVAITVDHALPGFRIAAEVKTTSQTGVEMEALTAVSVAALTLYDMLKAVDKGMRIEGIAVTAKQGGKSNWV